MRACRRSAGAERPLVAPSSFTSKRAWRLALAMGAIACVRLLAPLPAAATPQPAHSTATETAPAQPGHGTVDPPASAAQPAPPPGEPAPHSPPADTQAHGAPSQDPAAAHAPTAEHAASAEGEGEHGESVWSFAARILNFVLLFGGLYYLLRTPLANYLDARSRQIRSDLDDAARVREESKTRLSAIEARLKALPGEIEAMRTRGKHEIEAEQERIRQTAEAERVRLVEQTGREIDRQVQLARRALTEHAANLAIDVARKRLASEMTDADQMRLVDRYVTQLGTAHD